MSNDFPASPAPGGRPPPHPVLPGFEHVRRLWNNTLGTYAARIDRCVHLDAPCVVIGWALRHDGRKPVVGTALFSGVREPFVPSEPRNASPLSLQPSPS